MNNNKHKILIIEDEQNISNFVRTVLETNHYQVLSARTGQEGKTMGFSHNPDLIILDLGLPDLDGCRLIEIFRKKTNLPIIVLSARTSEADKVKALDLGANDYITKPFGTGELLARVRATLRSSRFTGIGSRQVQKKFQIRNMIIEYEMRRITIDGREIHLTQTEYNIVELLSVHAGRVLTYSEIIKKIWGYSDSGSIKKLQVNMANIRKKFGEKPGEYLYILNELGVGYRMNEDSSLPEEEKTE